MSVQEFNSTVIELINDLATAIPTFTDLTIVASLASGMFRLDPNNSTVLDTFYPLVKEHEKLIDMRQDDAILKVLQNLLPGQYSSTADYVWGELSQANKDVVWQYISVLKDMALKIKVPPKSKGLPENSELFVIYNNIWKEFLQMLQKDETKSSQYSVASKTLLEQVTVNENMRSFLHSEIKESMSPILSRVKNTTDIMNLIIPKDMVYMKKEVEIDLKRLPEDSLLCLNKELKIVDILESVQTLTVNHEEVALYWHYIKVLTTVLGDCPPELSDLLSSMASTLGPMMEELAGKTKLEN